VEANVDGVPVMECKYGVFNGQYALRVEKLLRSNSSEYIKGEPYGE
jgi:flagellar motor switch protein FliM